PLWHPSAGSNGARGPRFRAGRTIAKPVGGRKRAGHGVAIGSSGVDELVFREVDRGTWPDFVGLFESRGGPKSCWCMVWRSTAAEARQPDGANRRAAMQSRVDAGVPIGILGYRHDAAIAWCSIAPRPTYRPLGGLEATPTETVWSLACFFIK